MLEPGAEPGEDRAPEQGAGHDDPDPLVGDVAAAGLEHEDHRGGGHPQPHEQVVGADRQAGQGGVHGSGVGENGEGFAGRTKQQRAAYQQ